MAGFFTTETHFNDGENSVLFDSVRHLKTAETNGNATLVWKHPNL